MKTSNILLLLVGAAIIYYVVTSKGEKKEEVNPNDVTKWDDAKINQYLVESCEVKKKGILTGSHEKPLLFDAAKKEALKRGLSLPKCAMSSVDMLDQSFNCPKCGQPSCKCRKLAINDMVKPPSPTATGAMPKCVEGTAFINGRCLPLPNKRKKTRVGKQFPPSESYAFPKYINPEGEGYTLQNA